jgi:hypothetical protein
MCRLKAGVPDDAGKRIARERYPKGHKCASCRRHILCSNREIIYSQTPDIIVTEKLFVVVSVPYRKDIDKLS